MDPISTPVSNTSSPAPQPDSSTTTSSADVASVVMDERGVVPDGQALSMAPTPIPQPSGEPVMAAAPTTSSQSGGQMLSSEPPQPPLSGGQQAVASTAAPTADQPELHPLSGLSLAERGQLFFRKYQYINGENLDPIEAEQRARADYRVMPLSEAEIVAMREKNVFQKIADHPVVTSLSAAVSAKLLPKGQETRGEGQGQADSQAASSSGDTSSAAPAVAADSQSVPMAQTVAPQPTSVMQAASPTGQSAVSPLQKIRDLAAKEVVHVAERIAGHAVTEEQK